MSAISGWKTMRLDEMSEIVSGSTPATGVATFWNGDIVWVTPYDLSRLGSPYLIDSAKKITSSGLAGSSTHLSPAKSLVMSSRAPIGYLALPIVEFCTNQGCKTFKLKPEIQPAFAYYNVAFNMHKIKNLGEGTTFAEISKTALSTIEMDFPKSCAEQSKIAEVLSTVDQAIEQTEILIAKQQRIKTGLMQDLLTRGIDEQGQLRNEATQAFKYSPLGRIPVEWSVEFIENLLADVDPAMRSGPFGSALLKEELTEIGVPLLGIDNVHTELFVDKFIRFVDPGKAEALKRYFVRAHDIMITIMGTVGRCCVVPNDIGPALSSKHTWTISLDPNKYRPYLACIQINHAPWVLAHFAKDEQGGIMSSIKSDTLRATLLPVPPLGEALEIEARLSAMDADLALKRVLLNKLKYQKIALMQDLLTGHKRVTALLEPTAA
jgi:type I restriction enzyme S subunit